MAYKVLEIKTRGFLPCTEVLKLHGCGTLFTTSNTKIKRHFCAYNDRRADRISIPLANTPKTDKGGRNFVKWNPTTQKIIPDIYTVP